MPDSAATSRWAVLLTLASLGIQDSVAHENEELEEIIVRGRWDQPFGLSVSASQGFVSQAEIDLRPRLRAGDILEVVPGLVVTQHSGSGKSNQMFLRGFNLDHGTDFATWIDGMPINMPTHGHGQGYTDLNFIIPELVDSVEFRKGPYYADVSDFSSAGAAFFSTPSRLDSSLVKAGLGRDGFSQLLYADSFSADQGDLLLGLQTSIYDGPWVGVSEDLRKHNGVLRFTSSRPDEAEWNVMLMAYDAEWNSADQVPLRAVSTGLVSRLGTIDDTVGGRTSRYSVSGRWHGDFGEQSITVRAYAVDYELALYSNFTYFLDNPQNGDQIEQADDRIVYGGDLQWRYRQSNGTSHSAGLVVRYDDIEKVGLYNAIGRQRVGTVREDSVGQLSTGIYYNFEQTWKDRWRTTLGVRADYFSFDVNRSNLAVNAGKADDFVISPKFNLIRTLTDDTEVYFSAGTAFHSNDARGTVIRIDPASGNGVQPVDPLVTSKGAEVGFRYFSENRLNLSAALWVLDLDSELLFVGDAGNTEPARASTRYGIEVPVYFRLNDYWLFDVELALTESRFRDSAGSGDEVPGSVDLVVGAGAVAQFGNGAYGTLRARHFGDRPLIEDGSVRSGSSTIWNLGLGYGVGKWDFRLELLNLFDSSDDDITYYYDSRLPGEAAGGVADLHFHPIEPRTYRAYITWYNDR